MLQTLSKVKVLPRFCIFDTNKFIFCNLHLEVVFWLLLAQQVQCWRRLNSWKKTRFVSIARHSSTWQTLWMPRLPWKIPPSQRKPRNPRHSMNADLTFGRCVGELALNHMRHWKYVYNTYMIYMCLICICLFTSIYLYILISHVKQQVRPLDDFQITEYSEDVGIKFDFCWCKSIPHRMESLSLGKMI